MTEKDRRRQAEACSDPATAGSLSPPAHSAANVLEKAKSVCYLCGAPSSEVIEGQVEGRTLVWLAFCADHESEARWFERFVNRV